MHPTNSLASPKEAFPLLKGTPSLHDVHKWYTNHNEVVITEYDFRTSEETTVKGFIKRIDPLYSTTDALIWLDTHRYGIYVRDITAYLSLTIIQDTPHSLPLSQTVLLKAGDYSVRVNKQLLGQQCTYFKHLFEIGMSESYLSEYDLSHTFTPKALEILLKHLNAPSASIYSLYDALTLLNVGGAVSSSQTIQRALEFVSRLMYEEPFLQLTKNIESLPPLIGNWISNIAAWRTKHPQHSRFSLFLPELPQEFLYIDDINEHEEKMNECSQKLKNLTHLDWSYDGLKMISTRNYTWYPKEPKHPSIHSHKMVEILIARGILSGEEPTHFDYQWKCKMLDADALLLLDGQQLSEEIEEASQLLSAITGYECNLLHLYPVPTGQYFEVLEKIGCINVKEYFAFNVPITNVDINKLRLLKNEAISMEELWARYNATNKNKPLFEQIIRKKPEVAEQSSLLVKYSLMAPKPQAQTQADNYLGFEPGFLIGKRF